MSKLRVGDIDIDGSAVRIGGRPQTPGAAARTERPPSNETAVQFLRSLKELAIPARVIGWSGALLGGLGFILGLAGGAWQDPIGATLRGGFLLPIGTGLIAAAILKRMLEQGTVRVSQLTLGDEAEEMAAALRPMLAAPLKHQTIEWLGKRTGWTERTIVTLLEHFRANGELEEELDNDSGEFYYYFVRRAPENLDARIANIHKGTRV